MTMIADPPTEPRWIAPARQRADEQRLAVELGIPPLVCAALVARGIQDPAAAEAFLNPSLDDLHNPMALPDAEAAVTEIMSAKERGEIIYVHGDYDVDGVTSAAIWTRSLRKLGFNVIPHVPHRMKEGYGIHETAVQAAVDAGAKLFVTCDCGSGAIASLAKAREAGLRVVVTDHHELGTERPIVNALVNPHRPDSAYPFKELCGAGVAFKIAQAVAEECGAKREQFIRAYLDLVCLGTIADVVPLVGENRILASHGLKALTVTKKVGIRALLDVAQIADRAVNEGDVGWKLGPRLNAAGRIDDAAHALDLLMTEDPTEAAKLAQLLNTHNVERKLENERILAQAEEIILENGLDKKSLIMVAAPGWHPGVVGIVAGKLVERYYRPALVGCIDEETGTVRGSARSIPAFHLHAALQKHEDLFLSCGGHAFAAGFAIDAGRLDEVCSKLEEYAAGILSSDDLVPTYSADAEIVAAEIDLQGFLGLERMAPFGQMNPEPAFILKDCALSMIKPTRTLEHMQFAIECGKQVRGIAFGMGQEFDGLQEGDSIDLLFKATVNRYNGTMAPKLELKALRSVSPR